MSKCRAFESTARTIMCAVCAAFALVPCGEAHAGSAAAILGGTDSRPIGQASINGVNDIASGQYAGRGYTPVVRNNVTKEQFIDLLRNPTVTHVVYTGHGSADADGYIAELHLAPGNDPEHFLSYGEVASLVPLGRRQQIRQVVFNACGQLRQEWAAIFPNARIHGWTGTVTLMAVKWDQSKRGAARTSPKTGRGDTVPGLEGLPVDSRIQQAVPIVSIPGTNRFEAAEWWNLAAFPWLIPPALAPAFGDRVFNVFAGTPGVDEVPLAGLAVSGGRVVAHSPEPLPNPEFVLRFSHDSFQEAFADIDTLPSAFAGGDAAIEGNMTGIDPATLYAGAVAVIFGFEAVPPPCPGDSDGSGLVDFGDITSALVNWGTTGPPFSPGDGDGNGVVDFGDVTAALVNWGNECG